MHASESSWATDSTALSGPATQAYAVDIISPQHRGLGIALYRSMGDVGFLGAPLLVGALADAYSLEVAMRALAIATIGSGGFFWINGTQVAKATLPTQRASKKRS
jgi:MFS family permease|eukprot:COSAG01_NODE_281_length_19504_cov_129.173124_10_plen_105_part_00